LFPKPEGGSPPTRRRVLLAGAAALALPVAAVRAQQKPAPAAVPADERPILPIKAEPLFNGRDFSGWYTFLPSKGRDKDPEKVFTVEDGGVIRVTGKEFGYFSTVAPYANYRLTFEVRWGEKKWPPRENAVRDSGCLVHFVGADTVWPTSFECQIQENDFGDIFHIGGVSSVVEGKRQSGRVVRKEMREKPNGQWNTVEVVCDNDTVLHIVNGGEVNRATQVARGKDGSGGPLNAGRIAFQSEGAEVFYRNIRIAPVR
jgi:hypothetical protein